MSKPEKPIRRERRKCEHCGGPTVHIIYPTHDQCLFCFILIARVPLETLTPLLDS